GNTAWDSSFYELVGRLVPLQFFGAAKQIISEVQRLGADFDLKRGAVLIPPDWVVYQHWYELLKVHCKIARQFIRDKYKADPSAKRPQLWNEYCEEHFCPPTIRGP